jgi:integrase
MRGHILKRGRESWAIVVDLGRDPMTGKRRQSWRTVRGTKRDAEALLTRLLHDRDLGVEVRPGRVTVAQFLERWLQDYARPNTAPKTFLRYSQLVRVHLLPALGTIPLSKLRPLHIQGAYSVIQAKGVAARTVLHCHRVLREALAHAVKWQLLGRNPADDVDAPRADRPEVKAPNAEELRRLLVAAESTSLGALVHTASMTGLRLGELMGLRWQDVDLDAGTLCVLQTAQWLPKQGVIFRQPKTARSRRTVDLSPGTVGRLRQHRQDQLQARLLVGPAYEDRDLVFATAVGMPLDPGNVRRTWARIVRAAGLDGVRFHDLRHAHASLMLQQGVHVKVISERLGHSGIGITMDTYGHLMLGLQAEAAASLDRLVQPR